MNENSTKSEHEGCTPGSKKVEHEQPLPQEQFAVIYCCGKLSVAKTSQIEPVGLKRIPLCCAYRKSFNITDNDGSLHRVMIIAIKDSLIEARGVAYGALELYTTWNDFRVSEGLSYHYHAKKKGGTSLVPSCVSRSTQTMDHTSAIQMGASGIGCKLEPSDVIDNPLDNIIAFAHCERYTSQKCQHSTK